MGKLLGTIMAICLFVLGSVAMYEHHRLASRARVEGMSRASTTKDSRRQDAVFARGDAFMSPGDTIGPNPLNGRVFAGSGRFQVYRQGNLTWRLDTESGESCILLATDKEWRKRRVYDHGCAGS